MVRTIASSQFSTRPSPDLLNWLDHWGYTPRQFNKFNLLCPGNNYMLLISKPSLVHVVTLHEPILSESINGNSTLRNQLQQETNQSTTLFILKIAFENFVFKLLAISFRHHCKIILDMDGALDTEQSAFSHIKQAVDANQSLLITYIPYTPKQSKMCKAESDLVGWATFFSSVSFFQSNPFCH